MRSILGDETLHGCYMYGPSEINRKKRRGFPISYIFLGPLFVRMVGFVIMLGVSNEQRWLLQCTLLVTLLTTWHNLSIFLKCLSSKKFHTASVGFPTVRQWHNHFCTWAFLKVTTSVITGCVRRSRLHSLECSILKRLPICSASVNFQKCISKSLMYLPCKGNYAAKCKKHSAEKYMECIWSVYTFIYF